MFKKEFEIMCESMRALKKEHEEELSRNEKKFQLDMKAVKDYCQRLQKKTEYHTLYEAAKKRVEDLQAEIHSMLKFGEDEAMRFYSRHL